MDVTPVITWAAPIASTLIITWLSAVINRRMDESKRDAKREEEERKAWRKSVDERMREQDGKIDTLLDLSCSQVRSDLVHKCHRYLDDLGCASSEEKQALWAQHENYKRICDANGIENHFIEQLVQRVMGLPERDI